MKTDNDLERQLRDILRQTLDREVAPDPTWAESPAARRVAEQERRRPRRWTIRLLAVAALITLGGGALLLGAPDNFGRGTNGWIAQGSGGDIYFLALDQEVRRVIGTEGDNVSDGCPAFSPGGRQLAYGRVTGEAGVVDVNGAGTLGPGTYQDATLVIADVTSDGRVTDRFTVDIGDGLPPPCPVWSPSGDRIAFAVLLTSPANPTTGAEGSEVWILTLADRKITVLPNLLATDLEFSPDGSILGISSGTEAPAVYGDGLTDNRIRLYELASGATRVLEATLGTAGSFTWSPEGGRIAYVNQEEVRVIDLATEQERVVGRDHGADHGIGPVWSPDGKTILYQRRQLGSAERHDVVLVWPDDLAADGTAREEVFTLFHRTGTGSQGELFPYWVTWSPDGEYLLFSAWPPSGRSLLGVVPSIPGSPATILVDDLYPKEDPENAAYVFWEPSLLTQTWGRLPAGAALPSNAETPAPTVNADVPATPTPLPSPWVGLSAGPHLLSEGIEGGVPITVTIGTPLWNGVPNGGSLCWGNPATPCDDPSGGVGLLTFEGREYDVYGEACPWSSTRPEAPATTVDDLIDALANQGSRNEGSLGPTEDITVDGYAGTRTFLAMHPVEMATCDEGYVAMFGLPGMDPARYTQRQDLIEEVWAVDVNGLVVVLDATYFAETPPDIVDELRAILASATFE